MLEKREGGNFVYPFSPILVLITGEAVSPVLRFMTHTGEWLWVQLHGTTRYEADNKTPKYIEVTVKVVW